MGAPTWTDEEDRILTMDRREGGKFHEIARKIGRTQKACMARYAALNNDPGIYMANAANDNIRRATVRLGKAINALIAKMPERQVREVLGESATKEPGTERIHKTASIERIAA